MKQATVRQFFTRFPDDDACLEHLFDVRYGQGHVCPKCERSAKWYRLTNEQAFSCQWCGHHIHPMVDSIFEKTRTPLQLWFYAIFLFTTTRHGVSGKELQRQLGVTYKTAWRMAALIREHMAEVGDEGPIGGDGRIVEVDETFVGGKTKGMDWRSRKAVVMGMAERDGRTVLKVVPDQRQGTLVPEIRKNIKPGTEVHTDELRAYNKSLPVTDYEHKAVNHSKGEYATQEGVSTNLVESFFNHLKKSIAGTHISVSHKHLERYIKEFEYRFNRRNRPDRMLDELLCVFPKKNS